MTDRSWRPWRTFWRSVFGLPLTGEHLVRYRRHTNRDSPPKQPVSEAWGICGRRAGKSFNAAVLALYKAISFDPKLHGLAPQELAVVPVIAKDRRQAQVIFRYLRGLCSLPAFARYVHRQLKHTIELHTGCTIQVQTAHYGAVRGFTAVSVVCDEVSFWHFDTDSANPDEEIIDSLRPALLEDALLFGISSPYAQRGMVYDTYQRSFGHDDPQVLCWVSDTLSMNPAYKQRWRIDRMYADDPVKAASEFGRDGRVEFRGDVQSLLDRTAIQAVTVPDRRELPPVEGIEYQAFTDPSGGSRDSFTVAVAHRQDGDRAVLDCIREVRPPFSPDSVVQEFATLLRSYGVFEVVGDRYGGEWPREAFLKYGITYKPSAKVKSAIYGELVAPINSGRIELLDLPILRAQLLALERRTARGGKDSVDHRPGSHDDCANSAAGALIGVLPSASGKKRVQWA